MPERILEGGSRSDLPPYDATLLGRRRASRLTFSAPRAAQGLHGAHDGADGRRGVPLAPRSARFNSPLL